MTMASLRAAAHALGGEVCGQQVLCPGPGHSPKDRSMAVRFDPAAPDGFLIHSYANDDWRACRDHVRAALGISGEWRSPDRMERPARPARPVPDFATYQHIWANTLYPKGTPVDAYLSSRGLTLPWGAGLDAVRWHPSCPFAGQMTGAMVAQTHHVLTYQPGGLHRTALDADGRKIVIDGKDRMALGPIKDCAVMLTGPQDVIGCLGVGEGIETTLSLRRLPEFGESPVWACLNAGNLERFPVLPELESLWIATDHDPAGIKAAEALAARYVAAGREAFIVKARAQGADLNDVVKGARHVKHA
jgi:putative DNA primase/helicase